MAPVRVYSRRHPDTTWRSLGVEDIPGAPDEPPVNPKAKRDALLTSYYIPGPEFTPDSVGVFDYNAAVGAEIGKTDIGPNEYLVVRGTADGLGGRVLRITQPGQVYRKVVFACAIVVESSAQATPPVFDDCWAAGDNPDVLWEQRENFPERNSSGSVQWTPAALITSINNNSRITMNDTTLASGWWRLKGLAQRWATYSTSALRGAKFKGYRLHIWGTTDGWNHNTTSGVTDGGSDISYSRIGPGFYANQLQPTPYYTPQDGGADDARGGATHSDAVQTNIGLVGRFFRCYIGGPHIVSGPGSTFDPGPLGGIAPDFYFAIGQLQQENGVRVDGIIFEDCHLGGGVVGFNVTYNTSKTPLNPLPGPGVVANTIGNYARRNKFMAINASAPVWYPDRPTVNVQNKTGALIYASQSITMDFGVGTSNVNVTWDPMGSPLGTGTPVPVTRKPDISS